MRWNCLYRLGVLVVHLELFLLVHRVSGFAADDYALVKDQLAQSLAQIGVFAYPFGNNVARALKSFIWCGHAQLRIDECRCQSLQRLAGILLRPQVCGQRLQAFLARNCGLGAALGLVGKVEVFKFRLVKRSFDARLQLIGQLALLGDGGEDGLAPAGKVVKVSQRFFNGENLHLVQISCGLLAVARDKRHGSAAVEQFDDGNQSAKWDIQRLRNVKKDFRGEIFDVCHERSIPIVHGPVGKSRAANKRA